MREKTIRYVHRLCPCDPCDVEGIQSWLEDLAAKGLFLIEDGVFCGVFSFERRLPGKVKYRLDVAQKRKPRFLDSGDELTDEELEIYRSMGWEYLLRYGDFRVYRSVEQDAPELNTESETHAITIRLLKQKHRSTFVFSALYAIAFLFLPNGVLRYPYRESAAIGLLFTFCTYGVILVVWIDLLLRLFRFRGYEKRLLAGDTLNHRKEWKKTAPGSYFVRALPILLFFGVVIGLLSALSHADNEVPHDEYSGRINFATVADVFPGGTITSDNVFLDYGTVNTWSTAISDNYEWNESCYVTTEAGEQYFCILRLEYHEAASEWLARGLENDYYSYDASRYRGKRFQDLTAPDLGVDSVRVYNSYGSLYVLMREGSRVVHAVVTIDGPSEANEWHLWAQAMAEKLRD